MTTRTVLDGCAVVTMDADRTEHVTGHAIDGFEAAKQRLGARPHEAAHEEAMREERTHHGMAHEAGGSGHENALHDSRIVACRQVIFPRAPRAVLAIMGAC